jgi:hypothetical protein
MKVNMEDRYVMNFLAQLYLTRLLVRSANEKGVISGRATEME